MARLFYVGGFEGGKEDYADEFFSKGIWRLFHEDGHPQFGIASQIKKGDVLLLKKQMGQGSDKVLLLAAGVAVGPYGFAEDANDPRGHFCYVDWFVEKCRILIPHQGLIKGIQERNIGDVDMASQHLHNLVLEMAK